MKLTLVTMVFLASISSLATPYVCVVMGEQPVEVEVTAIPKKVGEIYGKDVAIVESLQQGFTATVLTLQVSSTKAMQTVSYFGQVSLSEVNFETNESGAVVPTQEGVICYVKSLGEGN